MDEAALTELLAPSLAAFSTEGWYHQRGEQAWWTGPPGQCAQGDEDSGALTLQMSGCWNERWEGCGGLNVLR